MPKAEVGSTKYVANKMKAKGLQRLRWYCQICEKQCRDENGFKQHTMSEGHVRSMLLVGEDPKKFINDYSNQFKRDFLQLLRTAHGEKKVHMNNFYQEYIKDKEHIHMNSTKWPSLTEFAKYLGREGICRVEEGERGLEIQWIDDSPEAIARREDIKNKEKRAKGDEDLEHKLLARQIKEAQKLAQEKQREQQPVEVPEDVSAEPVKVKLGLGSKAAPKVPSVPSEPQSNAPVAIESFSTADAAAAQTQDEATNEINTNGESAAASGASTPAADAPPKPKMSLSALSKPKPANPLMAKNPLAKKRDARVPEPERKMSNAERIMKEELERKRLAEQRGFGAGKRQKLG